MSWRSPAAATLASGGLLSFGRHLGGPALALGRCRLGGLGAAGEDLGDLYQGIFLAMPALPTRVLAAPLLEGDHLGTAALLDHRCSNGSPDDRRGAKRDGVAAHHQHLVELDDLAGLAVDLLDLELVVGGDAVLLPAGLDDCEHRSVPRVRIPGAR